MGRRNHRSANRQQINADQTGWQPQPQSARCNPPMHAHALPEPPRQHRPERRGKRLVQSPPVTCMLVEPGQELAVFAEDVGPVEGESTLAAGSFERAAIAPTTCGRSPPIEASRPGGVAAPRRAQPCIRPEPQATRFCSTTRALRPGEPELPRLRATGLHPVASRQSGRRFRPPNCGPDPRRRGSRRDRRGGPRPSGKGPPSWQPGPRRCRQWRVA